jgi:hypothetical protein
LQPHKYLCHEKKNEKINSNICTKKKKKKKNLHTSKQQFKKKSKIRKRKKKKIKTHEEVLVNILLKTPNRK